MRARLHGHPHRTDHPARHARVLIEKPGYEPYEGNLATDAKEVKTHTIPLIAEKAPPTTVP